MADASEAGGDVRSYPFGPVQRLDIDPTYAWLREHRPTWWSASPCRCLA